MEKFLVDKYEVIQLIRETYVDIFPDEETVTDEEFAVLDFASEVVKKINALDAQKIEGIDLGKGDGKVFGD